jgi:hypothetical protein
MLANMQNAQQLPSPLHRAVAACCACMNEWLQSVLQQKVAQAARFYFSYKPHCRQRL